MAIDTMDSTILSANRVDEIIRAKSLGGVRNWDVELLDRHHRDDDDALAGQAAANPLDRPLAEVGVERASEMHDQRRRAAGGARKERLGN